MSGKLLSADKLKSLEAIADDAGRSWAFNYADALVADGRDIAGGWPGTLGEARARIAGASRNRPFAGFVLTETNLESLARRTYLAAKAAWHSRTVPAPRD
jgi:hypothetical protein